MVLEQCTYRAACFLLLQSGEFHVRRKGSRGVHLRERGAQLAKPPLFQEYGGGVQEVLQHERQEEQRKDGNKVDDMPAEGGKQQHGDEGGQDAAHGKEAHNNGDQGVRAPLRSVIGQHGNQAGQDAADAQTAQEPQHRELQRSGCEPAQGRGEREEDDACREHPLPPEPVCQDPEQDGADHHPENAIAADGPCRTGPSDHSFIRTGRTDP